MSRTQRVNAHAAPGAWKLRANKMWNIPDEDEHFDIDHHGWHRYAIKLRGLVIDMEGGIYGHRALFEGCSEGYTTFGRVSVAGKMRRAFTSSRLFERPDGSLVDVAVLIIKRLDNAEVVTMQLDGAPY